MRLAAWSPSAGEVELRLLGPMQLGPDDAPVALGGRKQRAVLALLALQLGRSISADDLVELVWGTGPRPGQPRRALHVYVANLRRLLRPHSLDIAAAGQGYRLVASRASVDVTLFEDLVAEAADSTDHDPQHALALYDQANEIWRGPALADLADEIDGLDEPAQRLNDLRATVTELRLGLAVRFGDLDRAVDELVGIVDADPWRERAVSSLMIGRFRQGRRADALAVAASTRARLADELGLDPSPLLRATEQAVLERRIDIGPPRAIPVRRWHLRTRLLAGLDSFVGRDDDVSRVLAATAQTRLVTIVGPGGVGKTRLAIETARRAGVSAVMVGLVAVDARGVVLAALDAVGLPAGNLDAATLGELLGAQLGLQPAWLLLDNAEHVLGATSLLALALLRGAPSLTVLVTSRAPLAAPGEAVVELAPLDRIGARRLFADRAALVGQSLDLDDEQVRDDVDQVCVAVDGLPLAIELAANRLRVLDLAELAGPMMDRFTVTGGELRNEIASHRTMLETIEWSYERLSPVEQTVLQRLAVFPDGATTAAAEAVCRLPGDPFDVSEVLDVIAALVDQSLVIADHRSTPTRFRLLEMIRQFADERGRETERAADVDAAFWSWAQRTAIDGARGIVGPRQRAARRVLVAELDNIRAGFERAVGAGDVSALVIADELALLRITRGEIDVSVDWLSAALAMPADPAGGDRTIRAAARTSLALATALQLGREADRAEIDAALVTLRAADDPALLLDGLLDASVPPMLMFDDVDRGLALADEAIALALDVGDDRRRALAEGYVAAALLRIDRLDEAASLAERSAAALLDMGDEVDALLPMRAMWIVAWRRGDREVVRRYATRAEEIERGQSLGMYSTLGHFWLTVLAVLDGEPAALERIDAALALPGVPAARQAYQALRSMILRRRGQPQQALHELATEPSGELANGLMAVLGTIERGWCETQLGHFQDAATAFEQVASTPMTSGDVGFRASALEGQAAVAVATGRLGDAAALLDEADALRRDGPAVLHLHQPEVATLRTSLAAAVATTFVDPAT